MPEDRFLFAPVWRQEPPLQVLFTSNPTTLRQDTFQHAVKTCRFCRPESTFIGSPPPAAATPPGRRFQAPPHRPLSDIAAASSPSPRPVASPRSEEHTSELQSQSNLVCRL